MRKNAKAVRAVSVIQQELDNIDAEYKARKKELQKELKKAKAVEAIIYTAKAPKYQVFYDKDCSLSIVDGNSKLGTGIGVVNTIAGDGLLTKKDGSVLCNVSGTCKGCCDSCKYDCYAIKSQLCNNTNLVHWARNTILATEHLEQFVAEFEQLIRAEGNKQKKQKSFPIYRWHALGEVPSVDYMREVFKMAEKFPEKQFYIYTKRFAWLEQVYEEYDCKLPSNLSVLVSMWKDKDGRWNYDNKYSFAEFIYDDGTDEEIAKLPHCPATDKNGHKTGVKCIGCKQCVYATKGYRKAVYPH